MVRELDAIQKRSQGNKDAGSNWAKVRHRFVIQMLVRLGAMPDLDEFRLADVSVPACFDREKLTPMCEVSIAWWDEVHKECFLEAFRKGSTTHMRFPRDADGKYNPKGEYREKTELLTVKDNKQGRFCFGVNIVDRGDGPAGERIELFDYTTKNIISIADTKKLINSTIAEVKQLPRDHRRWCVTNRDDGVYYSNGLLTVVQGVSDAKAALLAGTGIGSIRKLAKLSTDAIEKNSKDSGHQRLWFIHQNMDWKGRVYESLGEGHSR